MPSKIQSTKSKLKLKISLISEKRSFQHQSHEHENQTEVEIEMDSSSNKFSFLPRIFVNLGWWICLVPFYFRRTHENSDEIATKKFQKMICRAFCGTASFVCFFVAYGKIRGKSIQNNPLIVFNFWSYSVFFCWCFLFTNVMFRKQHLILSLINQGNVNVANSIKQVAEKDKEYVQKAGNLFMAPLKLNEVQDERRHRESADHGESTEIQKQSSTLGERIAALYFFTVVLEEIYHKTVFYLFPKKYDLRMAAEYYSGFALHSLFMRKNTSSIPFSQIDSVVMTISSWHFISWQIFGGIKSLIYIFVTFCTIFLIGEISVAIKALRKLSDGQSIWELFIKVKRTVGVINELVALPLLGIYMILVPFLSSKFIHRWDSHFIEYKVLMILQFVWPMIALIGASEASRMGEKFRNDLQNKMEFIQDSPICRVSTMYFIFEDANLGIRGGKFFTMSYGFLGTTLSVIMTYALVILGFLFESNQPQKYCCLAMKNATVGINSTRT